MFVAQVPCRQTDAHERASPRRLFPLRLPASARRCSPRPAPVRRRAPPGTARSPPLHRPHARLPPGAADALSRRRPRASRDRRRGARRDCAASPRRSPANPGRPWATVSFGADVAAAAERLAELGERVRAARATSPPWAACHAEGTPVNPRLDPRSPSCSWRAPPAAIIRPGGGVPGGDDARVAQDRRAAARGLYAPTIRRAANDRVRGVGTRDDQLDCNRSGSRNGPRRRKSHSPSPRRRCARADRSTRHYADLARPRRGASKARQLVLSGRDGSTIRFRAVRRGCRSATPCGWTSARRPFARGAGAG